MRNAGATLLVPPHAVPRDSVMSSDTLPGERDVLSGITALRIMCPNGEMPKEVRAGFWKLMDDVHAEITKLRAQLRAQLRESGEYRDGLAANDPPAMNHLDLFSGIGGVAEHEWADHGTPVNNRQLPPYVTEAIDAHRNRAWANGNGDYDADDAERVRLRLEQAIRRYAEESSSDTGVKNHE